jgi:hypothetical protein
MHFLAGMVVLNAMPITAHLIALAVRKIAIDLGNYYAVLSIGVVIGSLKY